MASRRTVEPRTYCGEQGVEPGRALAGGQRVERGDLLGRQERPGRRIVDDERALDPVDPVERVDRARRRRRAPVMLARSVGEPVTSARMMIGVVSPGANSVWSATYASRLSTPGG